MQAGDKLPVFLADNHAETAGWITRTFDLDAPYELVLIDAHSDATAAERSEEIREALRRVPSLEERAKRVEVWRQTGRLQAFNWIEPLLPRPLEQVRWLAGVCLTEKEISNKTAEAIDSLDGRLEVEPRSAGSFSARWQTLDLEGLRDWKPGERAVILAVDLDFFAGMSVAEREARFAAIWENALEWPGLAGVAFAVSRPWLTDDAEADALVKLALDAVRNTRGARLEVDATLDDRPDDSLKAVDLAQEGKPITRWDFVNLSRAARTSLHLLGERVTVKDRKRSIAAEMLDFPEVTSADGEMDVDGVWRFPLGKEPVLRVQSLVGATGNTRWFLLEPASAAYDLLPETELGKSFSVSPARWIYKRRRLLKETEDFQLDPAAWRGERGGRFLLEAEVETAEGWILTPRIELRIRTSDGFRGALSECGGMPYVFGIAGVKVGDFSGVETGWGSDCANLLIHAWRRNGIPLAWGDPGRLRAQLTAYAEDVTLESRVKISSAAIERGLAIDFGRHVAAVWEDRNPLEVLDGNDLVMHHLGGLPEVVELAKLAESRPRFSLRVPASLPACRVAFAGDVVLAGEERVVLENFEKGDADAFVVNLEGIPSMRVVESEPRYDFRFPPERLDWLKAKGVDAVSLANNHAGDAGQEGLIEGMQALEKAGIGYCGAGKNEAEASSPWRMECRGIKLAVFGISYFQTGAAGPDHAGCAVLPQHADFLENEFRKARLAGERIWVLVHGGDEYQARVNDEQRGWVAWLAARGASLIVGAHPHVIQRQEIHAGTKIYHSLGNAVYPRILKGADSGCKTVVEIR